MRKIVQIMLLTMIVAMASFAAGLLLSFRPASTEPLSDFVLSIEAEPLEVFAGIPWLPELSETSRIMPHTRIVYEYKYPDYGIVERILEEPSFFILGMTQDEVSSVFMNWEVVAFTTEEVVLRRDLMIDQARKFTIGSYEGFIAVFYTNELSQSIVELTTKPISALAPEEQARLLEGIEVFGSDELFRALEDFSS